MADGRLWTRPALRVRLAREGRIDYDWLKGCLGRAARLGYVGKADNPLHDRSKGPWSAGRGAGGRVESARYAYRITGKGRDALERFRDGQARVKGGRWRKKEPLAALFGR